MGSISLSEKYYKNIENLAYIFQETNSILKVSGLNDKWT